MEQTHEHATYQHSIMPATPMENAGKVEEVEKESFNPVEYGIKLGMTQGLGALNGNKKGNFDMLSSTAKSLVVFGIMIGVGLLILSRFADSTDNGSVAETEIMNVIGLFSDITLWGGIIIIVIMAFIIMRYLDF